MRDMPGLSNLSERLVDLAASGGTTQLSNLSDRVVNLAASGATIKQLLEATADLGPILISPALTSEITSLHRRTLKRLEAEGRFPESIPLSDGRIGYVLADVFAWNAARVRDALHQRETAQAPAEAGEVNTPANAPDREARRPPAASGGQRGHGIRTASAAPKRKIGRGRLKPKNTVHPAAR